MLALSWQLTLVSLLVLPPSIWLTRRVARMRRAITAAQQRELADLNVIIEEGAVDQRRAARADAWAPARRSSSGSPRRRRAWSTSSCAPSSPAAGGWRRPRVVFAAIPAVIYLCAGLPFTGRE